MRTSSSTRSRIIAVATVAAMALLTTAPAWSHCQVPCGIYDDTARVATMKEDASTISKAVAQVNALAGKADAQSLNQITRWVNTKEEHASNIIEVTSVYFLAQRVKAGEDREAYLNSLADHHAVIVAAMKTKQQASAEAVVALEAAIDKMSGHYHSH